MEATAEAQIEGKLLETLKNAQGYVTIPYLSKKTDSPVESIQECLIEHPEKIRKSKMQTDSGESLYTLNTPLSGIADAWHAYRLANAKKF